MTARDQQTGDPTPDPHVHTRRGEMSTPDASGAIPPRLFALVEETDAPADCRVRAWGLAFDDHACIIEDSGRGWGTYSSADQAFRLFQHAGMAVQLVWYPRLSNPDHPHVRGEDRHPPV